MRAQAAQLPYLHAMRFEAPAAQQLAYPCSGGVDSEAGDYLLLAPPFVTSDEDLDQMTERLARALRRLGRELA